MTRNALAVPEVQLTDDILAVEETVDHFPDRPAFQATGFIPVKGGASGKLHGFGEAAVMRRNLEAAIVLPLDNRRGDRQRVEQAGVIRCHKVRFGTRIVRPPLPWG